MADMGDEVGDGIKRFIQQRISDIFREWIREHFSKKPERAEDCFATLDDPQLAQLVTETLREQGIRYDLQRQSLSVGADGQIHERSVIKYAPEDFDKIRDALTSRQTEIDAALREQGRDLGKCSISLQNDAQTHALTAALEKAGIIAAIREYENSVAMPENERITYLDARGGIHLKLGDDLAPKYSTYADKCAEYLRFGFEVDAVTCGEYQRTNAIKLCDTPALLAERYAMQFLPAAVYRVSTSEFSVEEGAFTHTCRQLESPGWKGVFGNERTVVYAAPSVMYPSSGSEQ